MFRLYQLSRLLGDLPEKRFFLAAMATLPAPKTGEQEPDTLLLSDIELESIRGCVRDSWRSIWVLEDSMRS